MNGGVIVVVFEVVAVVVSGIFSVSGFMRFSPHQQVKTINH